MTLSLSFLVCRLPDTVAKDLKLLHCLRIAAAQEDGSARRAASSG